MPNSARVHDHNHGPIEAAIKETARGRAFLAEYARRVRQSDTLTMLAMIGRLERVCQDLAVRLAKPDRRTLMSGGQAIENPSGRALKSDIDQTVSLASEFASVDQNLEALDRIARLVDMLRDLDRRVGDLSSATGAYSETGRLADIATIESDGETSIVRSAEFDASERPWPGAPESQKHHPEDEVLDDIAKALVTA